MQMNRSFSCVLALVFGLALPALAREGDVSSGGSVGYNFDANVDCLAELLNPATADDHVVHVIFGAASDSFLKKFFGNIARVGTSGGQLELLLETPYQTGELPNSKTRVYYSYPPKFDGSVSIAASGSGELDYTYRSQTYRVALKDCRQVDKTKDTFVPILRPGRAHFGFDGAASKIDPVKVKDALEAMKLNLADAPYEIVFNKYYRMTATFMMPVGDEAAVCKTVTEHPYLKQFHVDCKQPQMSYGLKR